MINPRKPDRKDKILGPEPWAKRQELQRQIHPLLAAEHTMMNGDALKTRDVSEGAGCHAFAMLTGMELHQASRSGVPTR